MVILMSSVGIAYTAEPSIRSASMLPMPAASACHGPPSSAAPRYSTTSPALTYAPWITGMGKLTR